MTGDVVYAVEDDLTAGEFVSVLRRSGLAERRPVEDAARIARMIDNADLTVTARDAAGTLIGVSRCITDFAYCCYCSDLAVDSAWQGKGIGLELMRRSHEGAGPGTSFFLLSSPQAMSYYPQAGLEKFDNCFGIPRRRGRR
ncbi:MAG: GNAT family N-acetyltransferase [Alphaproteobacteria bacterium]